MNNMKDRAREKNSMIHVRFTEPERRKIKAICALEGFQMQEYIRVLVLKDLKRRKGKVRL
jgi:predicted DNA binding CopG/RHH family protein